MAEEQQGTDLGAIIDRHHEKLKSNRRTWEREWQEMAEYVLPHRSDFTTTHSRGDDRMGMAFEGTAMRLLKRFADPAKNSVPMATQPKLLCGLSSQLCTSATSAAFDGQE